MRWQRQGFFLFIPLNYLYLCSSFAMTLIIFTSSAVWISFVEVFHQLCFWFEAQRVAAWRSSCQLLYLILKVQTSPGVLQESLCSSRMCTWSCDSHSYASVWVYTVFVSFALALWQVCWWWWVKIVALCFPASTLGDCMDEGSGQGVKQGPVCGVILLRES